MKQKIKKLKKGLENLNPRSKWEKAVKEDALHVIDIVDFDESTIKRLQTEGLEKVLLRGARNWKHYSESGYGRRHHGMIAEAYCTPSELKKCKGGYYPPNSRENWLDVQARSLSQAMQLIKNINSALQLGIKI